MQQQEKTIYIIFTPLVMLIVTWIITEHKLNNFHARSSHSSCMCMQKLHHYSRLSRVIGGRPPLLCIKNIVNWYWKDELFCFLSVQPFDVLIDVSLYFFKKQFKQNSAPMLHSIHTFYIQITLGHASVFAIICFILSELWNCSSILRR